MSSIVPTSEQIGIMAAKGPKGPFVMVNLLKFRDRAAYDASRPEANENLDGREAYRRYGMAAMQQVMKRGGSLVWGGAQLLVMIGDAREHDWDEIVCVRYPSREAFLNMARDAEYLAAHYHREAGLERTALLCCSAELVP